MSAMRTIVAAVVGAVLCANQAIAQKREDTLRIGMAGSMATLSTYHDATPFSIFLSHALFDTIIAFDERTNSYRPLLATQWTRVDARTIDFEIRTDAKWHDGTAVDVDDVVYTFDWLSDPATRLHLDYQWDWIERAEKLGRTRLRLVAKRETPHDLARLAMHIPILPEHKHGQLLQERAYFGRSPIGSGPYRFVSLDQSQATVSRVETYRHGGAVKPFPAIARLQVRAGWKYEDRLADWRAGALDLLLDADPQRAAALARERAGAVTAISGYGMLVLAFDTRAREGGAASPLGDIRLRKALVLALDRDTLAKTGIDGGRIPNNLCWAEQAGCGAAPPRAAYDPAQARKLLGEIGAPVEIVLSAHGAAAMARAEPVARAWRDIGVRVRVEPMSPESFYVAVRDRTLQAAIYPWHAGTMPDVYDTVQNMFAANFWDLHEDGALHALARASHASLDDTARRAVGTRALALAADRTYALAFAPLPALAVHTPEVAIDARGRFAAAGFTVFDLSWR